MSLKDLKFESIGEEYIYLFEILTLQIEKANMQHQPSIEELRKMYKVLLDKEYEENSENHDAELKSKYEKSNIYWSDAQEKAIVEYLKEVDDDIKNTIFRTEIHLPLKKLVENIIFTFKLFRTDIEVKEIQTDCMSFLVTKLEKYDYTTGAKAYAYLGTIAKHYLMSEKRVAYNKTKSNLDIDENTDEASEIPGNNYELSLETEPKNINAQAFDGIIKKLKDEMSKPRMLPNDKKVAEAIVYIFENHDLLKVYNKNLVYYLIKERTGLLTKDITYSLSRFKSMYKIFKQDFLKSL